MRYLILVIFSWFFGCAFTSENEKSLDFPIDISAYHSELLKATKHPIWGGPIKVFESGETVIFQIIGSKDFFILNGNEKSLKKYYPNPPDTVSGGVFRYNPVSMVFPFKAEFKFLQNEKKLISFDIPQVNMMSENLSGDNFQNPSKILNFSDENMISHWWGSSSQGKSPNGGVFLTDFKKKSSKKIISNLDIENFADLIVSEGKIYVLEKYKPIIRVFDLDGLEIKTLSIPKSKFLKNEKLERPSDYLKLSVKDKVGYLEDYCLDFFQKGDSLAYLHLIYSADNDKFKEEYVLSVLNNGILTERKLDVKPLNFDSNGDLYFFYQMDSIDFLMKKPIKSFF